MRIGFTELLVILAVALIVLGPDKLPVYMKKLGQALREFRKYSSELTEDLKENVIAPLDEAQKPLREALEPLESMDKELKTSVKELEDSFKGIGKAKPAEAPRASAPETEAGTAPAGEQPADARAPEAQQAPAGNTAEQTNETTQEEM